MNRFATATRSAAPLRSIVGVAALTLLAALPAVARAGGWNRTAEGNLVNVSVLVQGNPTPLFPRWDQGQKFYFQAFKGRRYALQIHNTTGERVGVLIAVDGLNVVNGERSNLRSGETMYVLGPWETATIRGWRTSLDDVREFVFVDEQRSYAERTGQANGDMGWIRVLSFREQRPISYNDSWRYHRLGGGVPAPTVQDEGDRRLDSPAPPAGAKEMSQAAPESRVQDGLARGNEEGFPGTGWGDRRNDPVRRVEFNGEANATDQLVLRYEYESGLRALGIFPERRWRLWERENGQVGFAQPPKW